MFTVSEAIAVNDLWLWLAGKPRTGGSLVGDFEAQTAMELLAASASKKLSAGLEAKDVTKQWREVVKPILASRSRPAPCKRRKKKEQ